MTSNLSVILELPKTQATEEVVMPLEEFIISVYCLVAGILKELPEALKIRQRGFAPQLTDAEMITMEIVAECIRIDTDKGAWDYFCNHWRAWFPKIGSRANFAKHAANLWHLKQRIRKILAKELGAYSDTLHMADGFPLPVCHFKRAYFSRVFEGEATFGYCASKGETYYGFKGNVLIGSQGVITDFTVTAANIDERESLWDVLEGIQGMVIADKGLIGENYRESLQQGAQIDLQTAVKSNMKEKRNPRFIQWLVSTRRLVETVIGQLSDRFNIEKIRARKVWYLTGRMARKALAHTVCFSINKSLGNPPLQFDLLFSSCKS